MDKGLQQTETYIIRKLLEDRNLTKVARRTGLSQPSIANFYHGKNSGTRATLESLRQYFKEEYKLWETCLTLMRNSES